MLLLPVDDFVGFASFSDSISSASGVLLLLELVVLLFAVAPPGRCAVARFAGFILPIFILILLYSLSDFLQRDLVSNNNQKSIKYSIL